MRGLRWWSWGAIYTPLPRCGIILKEAPELIICSFYCNTQWQFFESGRSRRRAASSKGHHAHFMLSAKKSAVSADFLNLCAKENGLGYIVEWYGRWKGF